MFIKSVSIIILAVFSCFMLFCSTISQVSEKDTAKLENKNVSVVGVKKLSGEYIEFSEKNPGKIHNRSIFGMGTIHKEIEINRDDIEAVQYGADGKISILLTKEGKKHRVHSYKEEPDKLIIIEKVTEIVTILLSDVEIAYLRKSTTVWNSLVVLLLLLVGLGIVIYYSLLTGLFGFPH